MKYPIDMTVHMVYNTRRKPKERTNEMTDGDKYYIVVTEWNYPTESGHDVVGDFDTKDEALTRCFELCDDELDNFYENCGDYLNPGHSIGDDGVESVIVVTKNMLDDWFFQAKIVEVSFG